MERTRTRLSVAQSRHIFFPILQFAFETFQSSTGARTTAGGPAGGTGGAGLGGLGASIGGMPDFTQLLGNPALMNMATQIMQDPGMQNLMTNIMSGTLNAGQQQQQQQQPAQQQTQQTDAPPPPAEGDAGGLPGGFNFDNLLRA